MKNLKRILSMLLTVALLLSAFGVVAVAEEELPVITIYPPNANVTSGAPPEYLAKLFAEHGFAVEVWAYSDDKTNAILASGDLPDLMFVNENIYETMIAVGMLMPLDEQIEKMPNISSNEKMVPAMNYVREFRSAGTGKLYYMPVNVGISDGSAVETERNATRLNWEFYEGIGAPEVKTIWDLIPVVKAMLEKYPTGNPSGTNQDKNYGTVLNSGSDATYWGNMQMPFNWSGYAVSHLPYLLETDMVNGTYASILTKDSLYYDSLKWYNTLYREGLLDPDSITLDRPTQKAKVDAGNVMLPSGTNPGWSPTYYQVLLEDKNLYYRDYNAYGSMGIGINSKTLNLDACLAFLNCIASPDNYLISRQGPAGEQWDFDENGHVVLTEKKIESIKNGTQFLFSDGQPHQFWNIAWVTMYGEPTSYTAPDGSAIASNMGGWKEFQELSMSGETYLKWKNTNGGHTTFVEWATAEGKYFSDSPLADVATFASTPDDMMRLTVEALRDVVVNASWQMVFVETDEEFESIWDKMVADCEGLGAKDVMDWRLEDLAKAKEMKDSLTK